VKPNESQGHDCQRNAAEEKLRGCSPEMRRLVALHPQTVPALSGRPD
jgi:hypothetical protein